MQNINGISLDYEDALIRLFNFYIREKFPKEKITSNHEHEFYEIHFAYEGSYTYTFGEQKITLTPNHILIVPPGTPHATTPVTEGNYKFRVLSMHLSQKQENGGFYEYFCKVLNRFALKAIPVETSLLRHCEILIRSDLYNTVQGNCRLKATAGAFIYELFSTLDQFRSAPSFTYICDETAREIFLKELVNNPYYTLAEISSVIGYSPRHTARLIQRVFGRSLSQIRRERRT